mgnify:FL=1
MTPYEDEATLKERCARTIRKRLSQDNCNITIKELRQALKRFPNSVGLHSMLGQVYLVKGSYAMARVHFKRALKLNPTHRTTLKYNQYLAQRTAAKNPTERPPI